MPMQTNNPNALKPYNIIIDDGNKTATINMYGEVVAVRPVDWWTGEPIPGNFIAQDDFLRDLDTLAGMDEVTVHINSVGGDLYAGLAIHNRLKGLSAHVTTINDGLAASAGSVIFEAGDTRKVNAGSNIMIHGAATLLWDYYQTGDLRAAIKKLEAHNKAIVNLYAERTGRAADEVKTMVDRETWMTGQDAVDEGFADEVISDGASPVQMSLTPDRSRMMVNGYAVAACHLGKIPDHIRVMTEVEMSAMVHGIEPQNISMPPAPQDDIKNKSGGKEDMEIKNMEELRAAYPDLVAQAETAARAEGAATERSRIKGIEDIEAAVGNTELVNNAKYGENPINAEQLAFSAMKAQAVIGAKVLDQMTDDAKNSGAAEVKPAPGTDGELSQEEKDDEAAKNLIASRIQNKKEDK